MQNYQLPEGKVLILRSCKPNMTSYNGFKWPESGHVIASDWEDNTDCGYGLHGWLWGIGDFELKYKEVGAKWLAIEVDADGVRQLGDKVKFQKGNVIVAGTYRQAYDLVTKWFWLRHAAELKSMEVVDANKNYSDVDEESVFTTGTRQHASAAGYSGHASAAGYSGHASAAGDYGHASAAGYSGHASAAGNYGAAIVLGQLGKAKCGEDGSIILTYWDGNRLRHVVGYDGENGIKRDTWYCLNNNNEFQEIAS